MVKNDDSVVLRHSWMSVKRVRFPDFAKGITFPGKLPDIFVRQWVSLTLI